MATIKLAVLLGWQDLRSGYRRSRLGQFWITLGMAISIGTIGLIFGLIFHIPIKNYLPFLSSGIICWTFLSSLIGEGSQAFVLAENMIRQIPLPKYIHLVRVVIKNLLVLAHNLLIFPFVILMFKVPISFEIIYFPIGLALSTIALSGIALALSVVSARYRDLGPIVSSALGVAFYLTPVIWKPESLTNELAHKLLGFNPLYHLMQVMRLPLLGQMPTVENWLLSGFAAVFFLSLGVFIYRKNCKKISYWV